MRKACYIIWACWLVAGIVLKILGLVSWWVATSSIWIPASVVLSGALFIFVTADIGSRIKRKRDEQLPKECGNCLFGVTCDHVNATKGEGEEKAKCIGEKLANATRGQICDYYERVR